MKSRACTLIDGGSGLVAGHFIAPGPDLLALKRKTTVFVRAEAICQVKYLRNAVSVAINFRFSGKAEFVRKDSGTDERQATRRGGVERAVKYRQRHVVVVT